MTLNEILLTITNFKYITLEKLHNKEIDNILDTAFQKLYEPALLNQELTSKQMAEIFIKIKQCFSTDGINWDENLEEIHLSILPELLNKMLGIPPDQNNAYTICTVKDMRKKEIKKLFESCVTQNITQEIKIYSGKNLSLYTKKEEPKDNKKRITFTI